MTVYFVKPIQNDTRVKIGHTDSLEQRLSAVASEVEGGIELIALVEGGVETERAFHTLCAEAWVEGEWYRLNHVKVQSLINAFKDGVTGKRIWGRLRVVEALPISPLHEDRRQVRDELQRLVDRFGQRPVGNALTMAFDVLSSINPVWTRRRVRALWEMRAHRIDLFEYRDLLQANALTSSEMDAHRAGTHG